MMMIICALGKFNCFKCVCVCVFQWKKNWKEIYDFSGGGRKNGKMYKKFQIIIFLNEWMMCKHKHTHTPESFFHSRCTHIWIFAFWSMMMMIVKIGRLIKLMILIMITRVNFFFVLDVDAFDFDDDDDDDDEKNYPKQRTEKEKKLLLKTQVLFRFDSIQFDLIRIDCIGYYPLHFLLSFPFFLFSHLFNPFITTTMLPLLLLSSNNEPLILNSKHKKKYISIGISNLIFENQLNMKKTKTESNKSERQIKLW